MKTMLERLLGHLHRAVFDVSPDKVVAFYMNGPQGSSWVAKDENFDITFADGRTLHYDLNNFTIAQFANQLNQDGMIVTRLNPDTRLFSGITMLELTGEGGKDNPVTLYRDILHSIFGAYGREMRAAQDAVNEGINQMFVPTANDGFLDTWGTLFGVPRGTDDDDKYRIKIPTEAFRLRVNSYAIEKTVKDTTGYDITIQEPWRDVFRLDHSYMSGADRLYDGTNVGYFLVQPTAQGNVDWDLVLPIIQRNLAAGVDVLKPAVNTTYFVNDPLDGTIWWQTWTIYGTWVKTDTLPRLDNGLVLSGDYKYQMNYSTTITTFWTSDNFKSGNQLLGDIRRVNAQSLDYWLDWGKVDIKNLYQGIYEGAFLKVYSSDPRTWTTGGWDPNATWTRPYDVSILIRYSSLEDSFGPVNATVNGKTYSHATSGDIWSDLRDWDDDDWAHGIAPFYPTWYDATQNFTPTATADGNWEMTASRAVTKLFNVGVRTQTSSSDSTAVSGVTWQLAQSSAAGVAVITTVNDHTWSVNTTGTGDAVIRVEGTDASGNIVTTTLTLHVVA
ncbi:hypothetical protein Q6670_004070 [Salmonella enterica]|nr:hypothetical protein [Salmonella enterica]